MSLSTNKYIETIEVALNQSGHPLISEFLKLVQGNNLKSFKQSEPIRSARSLTFKVKTFTPFPFEINTTTLWLTGFGDVYISDLSYGDEFVISINISNHHFSDRPKLGCVTNTNKLKKCQGGLWKIRDCGIILE